MTQSQDTIAESQYTIPKVQKAIVCENRGPNYSLKIDHEYPVPEPQEGEVLVKLSASGVCHSDLSMFTNHWKVDMDCDVAGHEGVGRIVAHGPKVNKDKYPLGLRVGVPLTKRVCQECESCLHPDGEVYCDNIEMFSVHANGSFQQYTTLAANYLVQVPEDLPDKYAGPVLCGGVTAYKGIKKANLQAGDFLVIMGAGGGLGSLGIFYANCMGLRTIAIDLGESKRESCLKYGAELYIDAEKTPDYGAEVHKYTKRGAHGVLVLPPNKKVYTQALTTLGKHSTLVCVGIPGFTDSMDFTPAQAIYNNVKIVGSLVGSRKDLNDCIRIAAHKKIDFPVKEYSMEDCKMILDQMAAGKLVGRACLCYE